MLRNIKLVFIVVHLAITRLCFGAKLPLCEHGKDTYGKWVRMEDVKTIPNHEEYINSHFLGGGPGEAANFSQIWIPDNCAVHRFTQNSTEAMVLATLKKMKQDTPLRIIFLGDSATRGLYCGITRILSGSEHFGPCSNAVCGTTGTNPVTHKHTHKLYDEPFGPNLTLSYMYIKSLSDRFTNWMVEGNIGKKPYALVLNTGAWDFDHVARKHMNEIAGAECDQQESKKVSLDRISPNVVANFKEYGGLAKSLGVRAIYRNNHYNSRFGALCADIRLERAIQNTSWEIWDNRRISIDIWQNSTYDGFHFDRHNVHTPTHHAQIMALDRELGKDVPGALEIQLAQSLLFNLFRDVLPEYVESLSAAHV